MNMRTNGIRSCRPLGVAALAMAASSCAWISTYVDEPLVDIEKISTPTARIASAHFWLGGDQLSLRGEVVPNPISKSPLKGHLDIEIVDPDQTRTVCLTTPTRLRPRHVRKTYSVAFDALPPPGSTIRVWHHPESTHGTCQPSPSSTKTTRAGGSSV